MVIIINLNTAEEKALKTIMADPQYWAENFVRHRAKGVMNDIYNSEIQKLRDAGAKSIPLDIEEVVLSTQLEDASARNIEFTKKILEEMEQLKKND